MSAVPRRRAGLASAINNTARQGGGAVGIALAGAIAGQPSGQQGFLSGFYALALAAAGLYVVVAGVELALIRTGAACRG